MPSFDCQVKIYYLSPVTGSYLLLTPAIDTTCTITESNGVLSLNVEYGELTGTTATIPNGVTSIEVEFRIRGSNLQYEWTRTNPYEITRLRVNQSSTTGSAYAYPDVYAEIPQTVYENGGSQVIGGVTYYFVTATVSAVTSFNISPGYQYVSFAATVAGSLTRLFEPGNVFFMNGRAYVNYRIGGNARRQELCRCNGVWYPTGRAQNAEVHIDKMVVKGLWAFIYANGVKYRLKLANYEMGAY